MTKVGLLSDTHSYLDPAVFDYLKDCREVWHAGDMGNMKLMQELSEGLGSKVTLRGVFGNIDGSDIRAVYPEELVFDCEQVRVLMRHIGGYPGKYSMGVKQRIQKNEAGLFISGHSHILKIMYDDKLGCLHMNPGAAGKQGWHKVRTLLRFVVDGKEMRDCEVIELNPR